MPAEGVQPLPGGMVVTVSFYPGRSAPACDGDRRESANAPSGWMSASSAAGKHCRALASVENHGERYAFQGALPLSGVGFYATHLAPALAGAGGGSSGNSGHGSGQSRPRGTRR
jgi:hypothetical protein